MDRGGPRFCGVKVDCDDGTYRCDWSPKFDDFNGRNINLPKLVDYKSDKCKYDALQFFESISKHNNVGSEFIENIDVELKGNVWWSTPFAEKNHINSYYFGDL